MSRRPHVLNSFSFPFAGIEKLYSEISSLFHQTQVPTLQIPRIKILHLYWNMGRSIVEVECDENISGEDHQKLLSRLSERLTKEFGEPLDYSALEDSCKFYLIYSLFPKKNILNEGAEIPEFQSPLMWEHYRLLIYVSCFIKCRLFERLTVSASKEGVLRSAQQRSLELFSADTSYLDKLVDK